MQDRRTLVVTIVAALVLFSPFVLLALWYKSHDDRQSASAKVVASALVNKFVHDMDRKRPECSYFKAGERYTASQLSGGCTSDQGTIWTETTCKDGKHFYENDAGWAFAGEPFHAGTPDWSKTPALKACRGL